MSKKLLHKINYYFLEYEETEELISKFASIFGKDFAKEISFQNMKNINTNEDDSEKKEDKEPSVKQNDFHELYKQIAMETHPDLHGDTLLEKFKRANEAYNTENWIDLIVVAGELNIEPPEFNEEVMGLINNNIDKIEDDINNWKSSLAWQWASVDEEGKEKLKKRFRKAMGIKEKEFKEFLKNEDS
tara:strand:+ start:33404 stop:33964 length:561 start_codon:yes stop_codon:yes gene_type:complete